MQRIQYNKYGGPEQMHIENFHLDEPGKGEVAVEVKFSAINPVDWKLRSGYLKIITGKTFPRAMGSDFSGVVINNQEERPSPCVVMSPLPPKHRH